MRERRRYVRHPVSIPIEFEIISYKDINLAEARNISTGGICFISESAPNINSEVLIIIKPFDPPFKLKGKVVWVKEISKNKKMIGVSFMSHAEWFRARMVEQICHIEAWRRKEEKRGRALSFEQAAQEWIKRAAYHFPY